MKRTSVKALILVTLPILLIAFQNCSGGFVPMNELASVDSAGNVSPSSQITSDAALKTASMAILTAKCASCHDTASMGNVTGILDMNHLVASGLVTVGDPAAGRLVGSIQDGTMPPAGTAVTAAELTTIKSWISSMSVVGTPPVSSTPAPLVPAGMTVASDPTLKTQAMRILQTNCAGCHQSDAEGGITKIMNVDRLVTTGLVVMGDPSKGRLMGSINDSSMPVAGSRLTVSATDKQTLQDWIRSMSLATIDPANPPNDGLPVLEAKFASLSANILIPKCVMCHGAVRADGGIRYNTYTETMRTVQVNNGANSRLYRECNSGSMPESPYKKLSAAELAAIKTWIDTGALNN